MLRTDVRANDFLVADSKAMKAVANLVALYADGDAPVMITGEHGTGRELVARVLHGKSPRRAGRFIAVRPTFEDAPGAAESDEVNPTLKRPSPDLRNANVK